MNFKYDTLIKAKKLIGCPPDSCTPKTILGFRWVYDSISNENNFLPSHLFDSKVLKKDTSNEDNRVSCLKCGLSVFSELRFAKSQYNSLSRRIKQKFSYTHIASGQIRPEDGVVSEVRNNGHYTFFESEQSEPHKTFEIIDTI